MRPACPSAVERHTLAEIVSPQSASVGLCHVEQHSRTTRFHLRPVAQLTAERQRSWWVCRPRTECSCERGSHSTWLFIFYSGCGDQELPISSSPTRWRRARPLTSQSWKVCIFYLRVWFHLTVTILLPLCISTASCQMVPIVLLYISHHMLAVTHQVLGSFLYHLQLSIPD